MGFKVQAREACTHTTVP